MSSLSELVVQQWETRPEPRHVVQVDQQNFREVGAWLGARNIRWENPLDAMDHAPVDTLTYVFLTEGYAARHTEETLTVRVGDFIVVRERGEGHINPLSYITSYTPSDLMSRFRPIVDLPSLTLPIEFGKKADSNADS